MQSIKMKQRRAVGVTLIEVLVVVLMLSILLVVTLPSQGAARRTARRMQNSTQLRGIHQGLVTFANSNKEHFSGLTSKGEILENSVENTGNSGDGDFVQARFWILLNGWFFTPEYAISPSEVEAVWEYDEGLGENAAPVRWNEDVKHYSYAMLSIDGDAGGAPEQGARGSEWSQTINSQAIVMSDRNTGMDAEDGVMSIHSGRGEWKGSVLWNDNHVGFEPTHVLETRYGNGQLNVDPNGWGMDNLFSVENVDDNNREADALMLAYDDDGIHGGVMD